LGKTPYPVCNYRSLFADLFILVFSLFAFFALVSAFPFITGKHCLQILGVTMRSIT